MTKKERLIEEKVKKILIQQLNLKDIPIMGENLLVEELGVSSFDNIEILFALEHEFNIEISEEHIISARKVKDIIEYIEEKVI